MTFFSYMRRISVEGKLATTLELAELASPRLSHAKEKGRLLRLLADLKPKPHAK